MATATDTTNDKNYANGPGNKMVWSIGDTDGVTEHKKGNYGEFTLDFSVSGTAIANLATSFGMIISGIGGLVISAYVI